MGEAPAGEVVNGIFRLPVRVYYEDTDAGGIVYHASYLRFAERARTEMLRTVGVEQTTLREELGVGFVVRRCEIDFRAAASLDDLLWVETRMTALKGASIEAVQIVKHADDDAQALVEMNIVIACIDGKGRPVRLPKEARSCLEHHVSGIAN